MTNKRNLTPKAVSVLAAFVMLLTVVLTALPTGLTADATTPDYVNWRSSDSRWSSLKYSDIGVSATDYNASMNVAFAQAVAYLGVGDTDESKFNPLTFYNSLKAKYDGLSAFQLAAWITYTLNPAELLKEYSSKISLVNTDTTSYSKSNFSTLASKLKTNHSNGYVSVLCVDGTWITVYNASSSTAWIMDPSGKYSNLQYYMNDGAKVTCVYTFKASTTRRASGWYDYKDSAGQYYIKNVSTGKYLTVDGNKDANATNVSVAALTGAPGQLWTLSSSTDGYKITPGCSTTKTLNPYADTIKSGTNVNIYAGSGETQEWLLNNYSGYVYIQNCQNTNCALNVSGTNVNVSTFSYASSQRWVLEPAFKTESVSGKYYIKNKSTGTYLYAGGTASTSKVALGAKKETTAYQMNISMVTSGNSIKGGYITPASGSVVLNPYADTIKNGTVVNLYTKNSDGTQFWVFEPVSGGYIIHNGSNKNLVLNGSGTSITVATNSKANSQIWVLESVPNTPATTTTTKATTTTTKATTTTTTATKPLPVNQFSGKGTKDDPYQISSKADLEKMRDFVNEPDYNSHYGVAYYIQTEDIDLENDEWTPIGVCQSGDSFLSSMSFDGVYDGNKHKITNLNVNWSGFYAGLFGRTQRHSTIENLSVYGNVTGNDVCTGGIVGEVGYGGKILNCSFNGTVTGAQLTGGITSSLQGGGTVSGCYVNAVLKTKSSGDNAWAGGIVGRPHVGHASNSENAEVSNCYFVGSVSGLVTGGVVGKTVIETTKNNTVTYSNNYFLKSDGLSASGDESIASNNGRALSEELMKNAAELLGTPFALNWSNNLNDGYPVFEWQVIICGDANNDGEVNVADAVILQNWLLGSGDLTNWQNVDLCNDGKIDIFDMILMRQLIIRE